MKFANVSQWFDSVHHVGRCKERGAPFNAPDSKRKKFLRLEKKVTRR